jgi:hypothetical protein
MNQLLQSLLSWVQAHPGHALLTLLGMQMLLLVLGITALVRGRRPKPALQLADGTVLPADIEEQLAHLVADSRAQAREVERLNAELARLQKQAETQKDGLSTQQAAMGTQAGLLDAQTRQLTSQAQELEKHAAMLTAHAARLSQCLRKIGIVRYNALPEMGGQQSFSLAIVDDQKNGVILSGLLLRTELRLYAKPLIAGQSEVTLSDQEVEALQKATA